jgi:mono/diheme cytochrome c family protein
MPHAALRDRSSLRRIGVFALAATLAILLFGATQTATAADDFFEKKVKPFLQEHCADCHGDKDPESKLSLTQFENQSLAVAKPDVWYKVQSALRTGKMPPKDEARPDEAAVREINAWIDHDILKIDCGGPRDPGRVTIRRLNRTEYRNTIRDLFGVDFRATDEFPVDDVGYGFDNIGDVLSTSPLLLEKYLAAAEQITASAIAADDPAIFGVSKRYEAESLKLEGAGSPQLGGIKFASEGRLKTEHKIDVAGRYVLRFRGYGDQAGDEPARMSVKLDGKEIKVFDVKAVQANPQNYEMVVELAQGKHDFDFGFINDYYNEKANRRRGRDRNLFVDFFDIQGPRNDAPEKLPKSHARLISVTPLASGRTFEDCAREILKTVGRRAYRRPLERDELDRLLSLVKRADAEGESFEACMRLGMQAILVSPHFLFRVEHDQFPNDPSRPHLITEFELATRLSYFLWSTTPDDELLDQAAAGTLRKNLAAQVRRMMADQKSQSLITNFSGQWLETRKLAALTPDPKMFPTYNAELAGAMREESERFFGAVVREDLPLMTLINGRFTYLNEPLAKHYGIDNVKGKEFRRVELADTRRGGILTQASVLTVTSNPTRTSPVKRGKWIMEQILGTSPPPPPPNVPELKEGDAADAQGSLRQRMEIHRKNAACASCHHSMDDLGFAFENYDAVGRWRDKDGKFDIDASGKTPGGEDFKNPAELRDLLASVDRDQFTRAFAERLLTYALGRGLEYYDKCTVDDLAATTAKGDYKFSALLQAIVECDAFQKRRAKRPEL